MRKIEILDEARDGREEFEEFDAAKYAKKVLVCLQVMNNV